MAATAETENSHKGILPRVQLLTPEGKLQQHPRYSPYLQGLDRDTLCTFYRQMYISRRFDQEATALQRQGQMALWVPCQGQEAAQAGSAYAYSPQDYIFPSYREHALAYARGIDLSQLIQVFRGQDTLGWDPIKHGFHPYTLVLAAQIPQAVGYAMGLQLKKTQAQEAKETAAENPAVAVYFGDGASTEGETHEAMVFAASYNAPVLFFIQNNQWAISVPFSTQSRVPLAQRAAGYGFEGIRVDGNDVLAVAAVTKYAIEEIRAGRGPVLIEAETYRLGAHTTADDPSKYRSQEELEQAQQLDPLIRLKKYLTAQGYLDAALLEELDQQANRVAQEVRQSVLNSADYDLETFFTSAYAQEHTQTEADRLAYRQYMAGFEDGA